MNISSENELVILEKYKLTPNEYYTLMSLLEVQDGYSSESLIRYLKISDEHKKVFRESLHSLQEKGLILKSYKIPNKGEKFDPIQVEINKNVVKTFWKASFDMGQELFETYPMFAMINGYPVSIRTISKKFNTPEDAFRYYSKVINWNPEKHKEIINLLKWEKENQVHFINMSLSSFIIDQKWNELKALKDGELGNINYDTIKTL
jgi:hypothetical protein